MSDDQTKDEIIEAAQVVSMFDGTDRDSLVTLSLLLKAAGYVTPDNADRFLRSLKNDG